jgi:hypothetical protein
MEYERYNRRMKVLNEMPLSRLLRLSTRTFLETIPLEDDSMPHCEKCQRLLCGVCSSCHPDVTGLRGYADCENEEPMTTGKCAGWIYAYQAVRATQKTLS